MEFHLESVRNGQCAEHCRGWFGHLAEPGRKIGFITWKKPERLHLENAK